MKKTSKKITACLLATAMATLPTAGAADSMNASAAEAAVLETTTVVSNTSASAAVKVSSSPERVSVHDPSIAKDKNGMYYVFGSHIDAAKSKDLVNWVTFTNGYTENPNVLFGNLPENLKTPFEWAGSHDCDAREYSVWAPDVFWNDAYVNADGTKGAYMMYFCTTSTYKRSVISYATSQTIEGPYTFAKSIVYSDFTKESAFDSGSSIDKKYTNTNIDELIAEGRLDGLNAKWFVGNTGYDTAYAPNAIDPELFYDENGRLWMTYGSWSGGIFILEIDPKTGEPIYPGTSSTTKDGLIVDSYFGTRISGGYTKSGEGPFIVYDKESGYYYLYVSYEGLQADRGYHMRLFRSKNPDGPYLDAKGNNAALTGNVDHNDIGIKVMGNYNFSCLETAYKAEGHNSALIDDDGQRYLIYHTRFANRGEMHQLRVHQQFINEEGWPVTAVFENKQDQISETGYELSDITGTYEFVNHGTSNDLANVHQPQTIKLNADGSITGDVKGTWSKKDGTYYMSITIDNVTYDGVFFLQHDESKECKKVMTFTAIGTNNMTIWGVRKDAYAYSDKELTERTLGDLEQTLSIPDVITEDLTLPTEGFRNTAITWTSSNPAVVSNEGKVTRQETAADVTLTAKITSKDTTLTKTYSSTVAPAVIQPDYIYDFETVSGTEVKNTGASSAESSASLKGTASVSMEAGIGNILTITGTENTNNESCLALPSDLFSKTGNSGYTLSMWVKTGDSLGNESKVINAKASDQNTPFNHVYFSTFSEIDDGLHTYKSSTGISADTDVWTLITYRVTPDGFATYLNGIKSGSCAEKISDFLSADVLSKINDIRIGSDISSYEGSTEVSFDNIEFYSLPLSESDILKKYEAEKNTHPNFTLESSRTTIYCGGDTRNTASLSFICDTDKDYTVSYASDNENVLTVDENGTITAKKAGSATITATLSIDGQTKAFTQKIKVKKAYLKFSSKKTSLKVKKSAVFKVKGYGLKASKIKWTSSKPGVLSVNAKTGKVTAKKAGKAKITAAYKNAKVSVTVTVKK